MKLFFAGCLDNTEKQIEKQQEYIINRLYSFATEKKPAIKWKRNLILDSGAFTEFTAGRKINIDELISFIKEHKPQNAIQLDKIGDEEETWNRFKYMEKQVKVLPVIHHKASKKHIERVLALNEADYISLGGLVPLARNKKELISWVDYLYSAYPLIRTKRVHCLGIMQKDILERYPFYSADSTSWLSIVRFPKKKRTLERIHQLKEKSKQISRVDAALPAIRKQLDLEKYITNLWEKRGITWEN